MISGRGKDRSFLFTIISRSAQALMKLPIHLLVGDLSHG